MSFNNYDKLCQYYYWEQYRRRTLLNYKYAQARYIYSAPVYVVQVTPENPEEFSSVWNSTLLRFQNSRTPSELSYFNDNDSEYVDDFLDNFS